MIKKISLVIIATGLFTSCVSKKLYTDLEDKYANLKKENRQLSDEMDALTKLKNELNNNYETLTTSYDSKASEVKQLTSDLQSLTKKYNALQDSYNALEENSSSALAKNSQKNRELLAQLEAKEQALDTESKRLEELKKELNSRSQRIAELENVIATKDANMRTLKDAISKALTNFEGKGLTVEQRDGKVYVSMENKLLFKSGSWSVGKEGKKAVQQLGSVLADNPEIAILIEGHTDNVPYSGNGQLSGNWDLSTKRATAIVNLLQENEAIKPENLTAAGRGEFVPVASNNTTEGKAKNRRIEVILTPKLDDISKLLSNLK